MDPLIESQQDGKVVERVKEVVHKCRREAADESIGIRKMIK